MRTDQSSHQCWICPDCADDTGHRNSDGVQVRCGRVDIEKMEALHAATTPGAWHFVKRFECSHQEYLYAGSNHGENEYDVIETAIEYADEITTRASLIVKECDADFIAASHNEMPALLRELRLLREFERRVRESDAMSITTYEACEWLDDQRNTHSEGQ